MSRIQVSPYCKFDRDVSWITQEMIEGYIFAWIKGEKFAENYVIKHTRADPLKMNTFNEVVLDDVDFEDLREQIWEELDKPKTGTIEYHIWQIERRLQEPGWNPKDYAALYKILGEYRGWLTKPGDRTSTQTVNVIAGNGDPVAALKSMSKEDIALAYAAFQTR